MNEELLTDDVVVCGWCSKCNQWIEGLDCGLPKHTNQEGERCTSSGYSATEIKYKIDTLKQALFMARLIVEDTSVCLGSFYGGMSHTIACGDGRNCEEERTRRAKALAQYLISTHTV